MIRSVDVARLVWLTWLAVGTASCASSHRLDREGGGEADADVRLDAGPSCDVDTPRNCRATRVVPAGPFFIGAPRPDDDPYVLSAAPTHVVTLSRDRWVSTYKSTSGCFVACVDAGVCDSEDHAAFLVEPLNPESPVAWRLAEHRDRAAALSFPGAERYCAWLGGRVPTEAEWMKMARGEGGRVLPWAEDPAEPLDPSYEWLGPTLADVIGPYYRFGAQEYDVATNPMDVGPYGHVDIAGLTAEWTRDAALSYDDQIVDPLLRYPADWIGEQRFVTVSRWYYPDDFEGLDIRFRWQGDPVDYRDLPEDPRIIGADTGWSVRCVFDAPPEPLCRPEP